jgi:uncharacterized protein (TIGR00369 family)
VDDARKQRIEEITDQLQNYTIEELEQVQHAITAMNLAQNGRLHYIGRFLGIDLDSPEAVQMQLGPHNANTYGVAQGGALYTLADIALGFSILEGSDRGNRKVYTLELKMNYIKPGAGKVLTARPQILHRGRKTVVGQCAIEDEQGDLVAQALGTFYLTGE